MLISKNVFITFQEQAGNFTSSCIFFESDLEEAHEPPYRDSNTNFLPYSRVTVPVKLSS